MEEMRELKGVSFTRRLVVLVGGLLLNVKKSTFCGIIDIDQ